MFKRITLFLILFLVTAAGAAWSAEGEEIRFSGDKTGLTDAFDTEGPWLLD